jgi:hypothetical protein
LGKFIYSVGTGTRMNIGKYVFEQTAKHAKTDAVNFPIAFPTLLCNIMIKQHPSLITAADVSEKREPPLTLHPKLFSADHVLDLVGTSGSAPAAGSMTNQEIIAKDTCVMVDKRKAQFELMIHSMEGERADEVVNDNEDSKGDSDSCSGTAE